MTASQISSIVTIGSQVRRNCFLSLPSSIVVPSHSNTSVFSLEDSDKNVSFVSWMGETHSEQSSNDCPLILLSDKLLAYNNFKCGNSVIMKQIATPLPCEVVTVSVVSLKDWQNLAINTDVAQLEFLNQVRVVYLKQSIPLWLPGGVCVRLLVTEMTPKLSCGLLLPLTYIKVLPPSESKSEEIVFNPEKKTDGDAQASSDKDGLCKISDSSIPSARSDLYLLTQCVANQLINKHRKLLCKPSTFIRLQFKVTLMPTCFNESDKKFLDFVIVSKDSVADTHYCNHSFMLAKIFYNSVKVTTREAAEALENKSAFKHFFANVLILENFLLSNDSSNMSNIFIQRLKAHARKKFMVLPDNLRRMYSLKTQSLVELETECDDTASYPIHIDVLPFEKLADDEISLLNQQIKNYFLKQCQFADVFINNQTLWNDSNETSTEVMLMPRGSVPLKLTKENVTLLSVKILKYSPSVIKPMALNELDSQVQCPELFLWSFGSFKSLILDINRTLIRQLGISNFSLAHPKFTVIEGVVDSGKSALVKSIGAFLEKSPYFVHCEIISLKTLGGKRADAVEKKLVEAAHTAELNKPAIVFLEDLDSLCPQLEEEESTSNHHLQLVSVFHHFFNIMYSLNKTRSAHHACVIITCSSKSSIDKRLVSLDGNQYIGRIFQLPSLPSVEKVDIVVRYLEKYFDVSSSNAEDSKPIIDISSPEVLKLLDPYSLSDLKHLALRTVTEVKTKNSLSETTSPVFSSKVSCLDILAAAKGYQPFAFKGLFHNVNQI